MNGERAAGAASAPPRILPARAAFAAALLVAAWSVPVLTARTFPAASAPDPELDLLRQRASDYVAAFVRDFSAAVAEEEYVQTAFADSESRTNTVRRVLRSDFLLVRGSDEDPLLPFRDVFEVDGRPVRDRDERLQKLFLEKPGSAIAHASRIAEESARYNVGAINRTMNVPTLPLQFLQRRHLPRFEFRKRKPETVDGLSVWRIDYVEKARPTLIRRGGTSGEDVPANGTFWIDGASGTVVRTRVRVLIPRDPAPPRPADVYGAARDETVGRPPLDAEFIVSYRPNDALGVWVPVEMKEMYMYGTRRITARATYSNFRRFQIVTQENVKVPK